MPFPDLPEVGEIAEQIVGMPGADIDYALCISREPDRALLRYQVWQQPGKWFEGWGHKAEPGKRNRLGACWSTQHFSEVKDGLRAERKRLFPDLPDLPILDMRRE